MHRNRRWNIPLRAAFVSIALVCALMPRFVAAQVAGPYGASANQALVLGAGPSGMMANGWKFIAQQNFLLTMAVQQRMIAAQAAGGGGVKALPDGPLVEPKTHFVRTSDIDVAASIADELAKKSSQHTKAEYTKYTRDRFDDFTNQSRQANMPLDSVPTSCTYYIAALYAIGAHQSVHGERGRDTVRGSCVLLVSSLQTQGRMETDAERQRYYDAFGIIASGLRWELVDAQRKGDRAAVTATVHTAHELLAKSIGFDPAVLTIDRLPCAFVPENKCDAVLPKLQNYLIAAASKYP